MTMEHDERHRRVTETLLQALGGTDAAGRTNEAGVAREALRDELRRIPDDATDEQKLDRREAALNRYLRAVGVKKRGKSP